MNEKYNHSLCLVLTFLVVFAISMMTMSMPAQASGQDIILNIVQNGDSRINSSPGYFANMVTLRAPSGGFFFLNLTIPQGYTFTLPSSGKQVASYAWSNKIIIYIISNNTVTETVDVSISTDSGRTYITKSDLPIANMVIGTTSFKFTKPTSTSNGYVNLSLGVFAGPILPHNNVKVRLAQGVLKNPSTPGKYTWLLEAKNSPSGTESTASDDVKVHK